MKIALIGANPVTFALYQKLKELEAQVVLFWHEKYPCFDIPKIHPDEVLSILASTDQLLSAEVMQVTKSNLMPNEVLNGRNRFHDLFRIIYSMNPKAFIEEQKITQPELYNKLSSEMQESLQTELEMFTEVDLVINTMLPKQHSHLGLGTFTLGERKLVGQIAYPEKYNELVMQKLTDMQEMLLVGSGDKAEIFIESLGEWLAQSSSHRLFVATLESEPFTNVKREKAASILKADYEKYLSDVKSYEKKIKEWDELDDFVKVKIAKPEMPIPQIVIFSGHHILGVDRLIDKNRFFVTLEKSLVRESLTQPENAVQSIKTLGVDQIIVATKNSSIDELTQFLDVGEVGYKHMHSREITNANLAHMQVQLEEWICSLFSKEEV